MSLVCLDCHAQNNNELGELNHKPGCSYATDSEVPQGNQDGAIPSIPESSIHEPLSANPSPSKGLSQLADTEGVKALSSKADNRIFVTMGELYGTVAKFAVSQSPYHRPENLELVLDKLYESTGMVFANAPLGVVEFKDANELYQRLHQALAAIPEYVAWNDRKNGNDSPMKFTSAYDNGGDPDDDFIDLDALERNVVREIEIENAETQGIDLVKYGRGVE